MATGVASWSQTAANNANADASVNWAEGMAPSAVNDSARAMMASVAKWRDDNAGTLTTGGTSTAYTVTTNQGFASLSAMSGQSLRVKLNATNGAAPTLNVDSLGAKAIVTVAGTAIGVGRLVANSVYDLVYDNSNSCWILVSWQLLGNLDAPSGTRMLFQQTAAPTGWTKDTSNNDKALRVVSGTVGSGGSTAFSSVFAARTIAQANLPNLTLALSLSDTRTWGATGANGSNGGNDASNFLNAATGATSNTHTVSVTGGSLSGTVATGGSGTALDFAVAYIDTIVASKD